MAVVLEDQRPVGADRLPAGPRAGRRRQQERADRHRHARWREMGQGRRRGRAAARRRPRSRRCSQPGDVIYVDPLFDKDGNAVEGQYRLRQLPEVSGAMVAMDPWTGRVLAMVGGFSFDQSQFNRATQAYAAAGLVVQAAGLFGGARQRLHAVDRGDRRARSRSTRGRAPACGVRKTIRPANITARRRCATRIEQLAATR